MINRDDEIQKLRQLFAKYQTNLYQLQNQAGTFAQGHTPLHLLNQIEAEKSAIIGVAQELIVLHNQSLDELMEKAKAFTSLAGLLETLSTTITAALGDIAPQTPNNLVEFEAWLGEYEQVDDVCIMGIQF